MHEADGPAPPGRLVIVCDVGAVAHPDLRTVDALARLKLGADRLGFSLRLRGPNSELEDLLDLVGLHDVLPIEPG